MPSPAALRRKEIPSITTIKITRPVIKHIASNARLTESVDDTLRRLLGLKTKNEIHPVPAASTVKISRLVMDHLEENAKPRESRDDTLRRLLGIRRENGNVEKKR